MNEIDTRWIQIRNLLSNFGSIFSFLLGNDGWDWVEWYKFKMGKPYSTLDLWAYSIHIPSMSTCLKQIAWYLE